MGSEADGLNLAETDSGLGGKRGGQPRSIRKRGHHRALKRGEPWAKLEASIKSISKQLCEDFYTTTIEGPSFLSGLSSWLPDTDPKIIPITYSGLDRTAPTRFDRPPEKESLWSRIKSWFKEKR
jgi:hypothetical protein